MISINISGVTDVIRGFDDFKYESENAIMRGIAMTARLIESTAKRRLKERKHWITGRLASSIHSESKEGIVRGGKVQGKTFNYKWPKPDAKGQTSADGNLNEPVAEIEMIVGTNVDYAIYVEDGHHSFAGDPFMRFAAEKGDGELKKYITEQIDASVKEANEKRAANIATKRERWDAKGVTDWEVFYN